MSNIVDAAIDFEKRGGRFKAEGLWLVHFVDNESRVGRLTDLDNGNFLLEGTTQGYFFSADKVIWLYPKN